MIKKRKNCKELLVSFNLEIMHGIKKILRNYAIYLNFKL